MSVPLPTGLEKQKGQGGQQPHSMVSESKWSTEAQRGNSNANSIAGNDNGSSSQTAKHVQEGLPYGLKRWKQQHANEEPWTPLFRRS